MPHPHLTPTIRTTGLKPKHKRGQNFLVDKNILAKIINAAHLTPTDTVLEIGAGNGTLTKALASHAHHVIAVEIDRDLIPILTEELAPYPHTTIIKDDIMARSIDTLIPPHTPYKIVANIPYSITSGIIRKFLTESPRPTEMILLMQKEVAERITRAKESSLLSLSVAYYAHTDYCFTVSKNSFWPKPKVDSAVIRITLLPTEHLPTAAEEAWFFRVLHAGFAAKRKLLMRNLANGLDAPLTTVQTTFTTLDIPEKSRAEELSIETWRTLATHLAPQLK